MDDETLRALQEQAHMLEELTKHDGWHVFTDYLHTIMDGDKRAILNGFVEDQLKYKHVTGKLVGIHAALDAPAIVRQMVNAELDRRAERSQG